MINTFKDTLDNKRDEELLSEENYKKVYKAALAITLDEEMAKDAVQEAFIKAFLKIETLRDKNKYGAWVCSIAVNICKDMIKHKKNLKILPIYTEDGLLKENLIELMHMEVPEDILERKEIREALRRCLEDLDIVDQRIIYLRYYRDLTHEQIANKLNIKVGTVKVKMHRAKRKVADKLREYYCTGGYIIHG